MVKFPLTVKEYTEINSIEMPPKHEEYLYEMYNFLNDAKFIDFAVLL
jgi:hypothetical protein